MRPRCCTTEPGQLRVDNYRGCRVPHIYKHVADKVDPPTSNFTAEEMRDHAGEARARIVSDVDGKVEVGFDVRLVGAWITADAAATTKAARAAASALRAPAGAANSAAFTPAPAATSADATATCATMPTAAASASAAAAAPTGRRSGVVTDARPVTGAVCITDPSTATATEREAALLDTRHADGLPRPLAVRLATTTKQGRKQYTCDNAATEERHCQHLPYARYRIARCFRSGHPRFVPHSCSRGKRHLPL